MVRLSPMALPSFVGVLLTSPVWAQGEVAPAAETLNGRTMGTTWTATWHGSRGNTDQVPVSVVADELQRLLERVDGMMSTWRDDAEISRFNCARATDWCPVSHDTMRVMRRALEGNEAALGVSHPSTLISVNNLAILLKQQGKYGQAEAMYRRSLAGREEALGPTHPHTRSARSHLDVLRRAMGQ